MQVPHDLVFFLCGLYLVEPQLDPKTHEVFRRLSCLEMYYILEFSFCDRLTDLNHRKYLVKWCESYKSYHTISKMFWPRYESVALLRIISLNQIFVVQAWPGSNSRAEEGENLSRKISVNRNEFLIPN